MEGGAEAPAVRGGQDGLCRGQPGCAPPASGAAVPAGRPPPVCVWVPGGPASGPECAGDHAAAGSAAERAPQEETRRPDTRLEGRGPAQEEAGEAAR